MPTNQQRRDAAKRKLERQLVSRQVHAKQRRQRTIIASVIVGVVVVAGAVWLITKKPSADTDTASSATDTSASATDTTPATPCVYTPTSEAAVKAVSAPANTNPLTTGTVDATITLGQGAVPITLDRAQGFCAVNAFISLATQQFYDGTSCHRLTTDANLKILQCGDPSGTGRGGPGFSYAAETSPEVAADPAATDPTAVPDQYPVGTIAMANTGSGSANGSQFFIVYGDSDFGSNAYTKIGTVSADGLAVINAIAAKGAVVGSNPNGAIDAPAEAVNISTITIAGESAVTDTQTPAPETTDSATDGLDPSLDPSADPSAVETTSADPSAVETTSVDPSAADSSVESSAADTAATESDPTETSVQ